MTAEPQPWGATGEQEQTDDVRVHGHARWVRSSAGTARRTPCARRRTARTGRPSWRAPGTPRTPAPAAAATARSDRARRAPGPARSTPTTWQERATSWRDGDGAGGPRALSVPVRDGAEVAGVLTFFGRDLRPPHEAELPLFEGVASMLGRGHPPADAAPGPSPTGRATRWSARWRWSTSSPSPSSVTGDGRPGLALLRPQLGRRLRGRRSRPRRASSASSSATPTPRTCSPSTSSSGAALAGQPREVEIRILGGDGVERWISWRSVPRRVGGCAARRRCRHRRQLAALPGAQPSRPRGGERGVRPPGRPAPSARPRGPRRQRQRPPAHLRRRAPAADPAAQARRRRGSRREHHRLPARPGRHRPARAHPRPQRGHRRPAGRGSPRR